MWAVLIAVVVLGVGVPIVYDALRPPDCPPDVSGIDCLPVSFAAVYAVPGLLLVLCGSIVRRAGGMPQKDVRPR